MIQFGIDDFKLCFFLGSELRVTDCQLVSN